MCDVMESDAKNNPERKFKIEYRGVRQKTLLLECGTKPKKDEWFLSVETAISGAKALNARLNTVQSKTGINVDHNGELAVRTEQLEVMHSQKSIAEHREAVGNSTLPKDQHLKEDANVHDRITTSSNRSDNDNSSVKSDEEASLRNDAEVDENVFGTRYTESRGYKNTEFSDFEVFDDSASQTSEYDHQFDLQHDKYNDIKSISTTKLLSPFLKEADPNNIKERRIIITRDEKSGVFFRSPRHNSSTSIDFRDYEMGCAGVEGSNSSTATMEPDLPLNQSIVRSRSTDSKVSTTVENARLVNISSFTIRLNDFN